MFNFFWKIVCFVAFASLLCLLLTGKVEFKDIVESTMEVKDKVEANIVGPIMERCAYKDTDSSSDSVVQNGKTKN